MAVSELHPEFRVSSDCDVDVGRMAGIDRAAVPLWQCYQCAQNCSAANFQLTVCMQRIFEGTQLDVHRSLWLQVCHGVLQPKVICQDCNCRRRTVAGFRASAGTGSLQVGRGQGVGLLAAVTQADMDADHRLRERKASQGLQLLPCGIS